MRHHLGPARHDQIFHPGHDLRGGQIGGGQATAAEAVERHARRAHIIARVQRRHPPHVAALQSHLRAGAPDHVVDIGRVDAIAIADRTQHRGRDMLGMQMGQGTLAQLAEAARRADGVDDKGLCQGASPTILLLALSHGCARIPNRMGD